MIGQRRPLLQVETGQLMLPNRRQKRKWNVTSCSWKAKLGTLHTEKNYLFAFLTFVHGGQSDRVASPSFARRNGSIDASKLSLKVQMERYFMVLEGYVGNFAHGKNYMLAIFTFVYGAEGDEAMSPSSSRRNRSIDASITGSAWCNIAKAAVSERQHFTHGKQISVFQSLRFLKGERATRQRHPLLQLKTKQLMLPARR